MFLLASVPDWRGERERERERERGGGGGGGEVEVALRKKWQGEATLCDINIMPAHHAS